VLLVDEGDQVALPAVLGGHRGEEVAEPLRLCCLGREGVDARKQVDRRAVAAVGFRVDACARIASVIAAYPQ
jgi:hypothetical protein